MIGRPLSVSRVARRSVSAWRGLLVAAALAPGGVAAQAASEEAAPIHADARGDLTLALTGDAILTRALQPYEEPEYLELRNLVAGATAAFTNLEVLFHDYESDAIPAAASGGTYMRAEPRLAHDLAWFGFDLVSRANNHAMDFGVGGMRATTRAVEAAGLVHAGVGESLALARAPAYLDTPGGRVALISVASTFPDPMRAGEQRPDMRGRPGLSPLRYRTRHVLPAARYEGLRDALAAVRGRYRAAEDSLAFGGDWFVRGDAAATGPRTETRADPRDLAALVARVREARRQADRVLVTSHTHESGGRREVPADFLVEAARAAIDAGADAVAGHGPHVLRGVEMYRGRPIFYSLGDFIFQNETVARQPSDNYEAFGLGPDALPGEFQDVRIEAMGGGFPADPAYWQSALAVVEFRAGELAEIRLHPVTLGHGLDRPQRGRPVLARGEEARGILERLRELSEPFGVTIEIEGEMGRIAPASASAARRADP